MVMINDFKFSLDEETVLNSMGCYSGSHAYNKMRNIYDVLRKGIEGMVQPEAIFGFYKMDEKYRFDEAADCTHMLLCMITLGKRISAEIEYYCGNDQYAQGMLLDAMSDKLLSVYSSQLYKKICREAKKRGLGLTRKLSPGNNGFPLERQKDILKKLNGDRLLDVSITDGFMMNPIKSVSFMYGADAKLGIPLEDHECSSCSNTGCKMRKEPYSDEKSEKYFEMTIIFNGTSRHFKAPESLSIKQILENNGIYISSPCGGNGTCGKCKIRVLKGKTRKSVNNHILSGELLSQGWCLCCSTYLAGDVTISLDQSEARFEILDYFDRSNLDIDPYYDILTFSSRDKDIRGQSLTNIINTGFMRNYKYTLTALRNLQAVTNAKGFIRQKTALSGKESVNLIAKGDTILNVCDVNDSNIYGIAIDIGTTTIALDLVNLLTGENLDNYALLNSQRQFGADVITRIQYGNSGNLNRLCECIKSDLLNGIKHLCNCAGIGLGKIYDLVIAGNTAMLYFLLGLSCDSLAQFPFSTTTTSLLECGFYQIFGNHLLDCLVTILPGVSAYVGADIVSGMLKCGYEHWDRTCMLIDIGTNGEMTIGNKDSALCLAAAAGPAFEGASITCGTGSINGAISKVNIDDGRISYRTIGDKPAAGICGSAVIDITAAMLRNDIINETGRFDADKYDGGFISIAKNTKNEDIVFTQKDIREVQLAKSAIRSGIEILLKEFNVSCAEIDTVFLAGGFGYHINIENAAAIGPIPQQLKGKVKCVGNSSLGGGVKYLLDKKSKHNLELILKNINYIDIGANKRFGDLFVDNMLF